MSKDTKEAKTETLSVKVTPTVKKKLENLAKRRVRKLSYVINEILTGHVQN